MFSLDALMNVCVCVFVHPFNLCRKATLYRIDEDDDADDGMTMVTGISLSSSLKPH